MFAMTSGINYGFKRGYVGALGMVLGLWTGLTVVAIGLGAILLASAQAFALLKWAGVIYLVYLGIKQWRAPATPMSTAGGDSVRAGDARSLLIRGWAVNATNPKGYVFMLAVMPQFIDTASPLLIQYVVIAATLSFTDLIVMAAYTGLATKALGWFKTPRQMRWLNRSFGGMFIAAAAALATFKRQA